MTQDGAAQDGSLDAPRGGITQVFIISAICVAAFILAALLFPGATSHGLGAAKSWIIRHLDWVFMLTANLVVALCGYIALSPLGRITLGGPKAEPEFSTFSWVAMLFSAGVGTGMVFYGTAEPAIYYIGRGGTPLDVPALTPAAQQAAFSATAFHWGITPWAIYAIVGLALAFFHFNQGLPLTIRSAFHPLLGRRIWGWPGHVIDIIAVIATIFGLATTLGMGATLVASGLEFLFAIDNDLTVQSILIVGITLIAIASVVRGLRRGIRVLSMINLGLAAGLLLFIILAGPTRETLASYWPNTVRYAADFISLSHWIDRPDITWMRSWTILYWAWWIAWSPFVGMFIARISKGRSVRAFLGVTILLPTLIGIIWFSSFGMAAIDQIQNGIGALPAGIPKDHLVLYQTLANLPWQGITSLLAICLLVIFFVTSSDSGSLVVDTITAGGRTDAPVAHRVFWASVEGLVAIALLVGGGTTALSTLQSGVIIAGLPFTLVLLVCCYSTLKGMRAAAREG